MVARTDPCSFRVADTRGEEIEMHIELFSFPELMALHGGARIVLTVENSEDPQAPSQVWLTADDAHIFAALLLRHAEMLQRKG